LPTLLSRTERTILLLLSFGRSHRDIAEQLQLTPNAVESSIVAAVRKLGGTTDYGVVAKAAAGALIAATAAGFDPQEARSPAKGVGTSARPRSFDLRRGIGLPLSFRNCSCGRYAITSANEGTGT
jgi:DNA-binding CsgD family transcriptional regulator